MKYIVTHLGKAHLDDFLSCCLVIAHEDIEYIHRKKTVQEDLDDKDVIVIDCGLEYNPERFNFDHHQFPYVDGDYKCSITLILKYLGVYEDAIKFWKWLPNAEMLDCIGPFKLAEKYNLGKKEYISLLSPVEEAVLHIFEEEKCIYKYELLFKIMKKIGENLLNNIKVLKEGFEVLDWYGSRYSVENAFFIDRYDLLNINFKIEEVIWHYIDFISGDDNFKIPVVIFPNERSSTGYKIIRVNDNPRVDFRRYTDKEGIEFVHNTGFIIITKENDFDLIQKIVKTCVA
jgi:hypothetical protein